MSKCANNEDVSDGVGDVEWNLDGYGDEILADSGGVDENLADGRGMVMRI